MWRSWGAGALVLALAMGCGSDGPDAGRRDGSAPPVADAGPEDAGTDAAVANGALEGVVTRTAEPRAGGIGHLYIGVFDKDPVTMPDAAVVVGRTFIEDADMSADDAAIPYTVEGIPPRAEPYFVTAFLDDDGDAGTDPETAGPDRGDLVSLDGLGSPEVTVSSPTAVAFDIVLNANLPF